MELHTVKMECQRQKKVGLEELRVHTLRSISKLFLAIGLITFVGCTSSNESQQTDKSADLSAKNTKDAWYIDQNTIAGNALGTSFMIKTGVDSLLISPEEISVFFADFNNELSTYIPNSLISQFNNELQEVDLNETKYFKTCLEKSIAIYKSTGGAFDPTIFPLVELWGFIKKADRIPTQEEVDSVLAFVGFEEGKMYAYQDGVLKKKDNRFQLIFNAIAKGQSVDELAAILDAKGQESYYIEVGGEIITKGMNDRNMKWVIGIDEPIESNTGFESTEKRDLENYIEISGKAMATSGNYRDFYEHDGVVYSHTISPITGKPVRRSILSATVIANDVATADAYATAFMVMGVEGALELVNNHPELGIDVYLLYDNEKGGIERAYNKGMMMYLMDK
ncbi:MAG TPA: FAD:protein FMN transferase [Brumimicrobium sp.]|nr:FAD:protein FMN transferase [Brumimicrobium sp.]